MKISELEKQLSVPKATIRFYESEGLLRPERSTNNYRDYSDADLQQLKQILILRKLGLSIPEIKAVNDKTMQLSDALSASVLRMEEEKKRLDGAINVCQRLQAEPEGVLDVERYWMLIDEAERCNQPFADIAMDYLKFEFNTLSRLLRSIYFFDFKAIITRFGAAKAVFLLLAWSVLRGIMRQFVWKTGTFWEGFLYPFIVFLAVSVLLLPAYIAAAKKWDKAGAIYMRILLVICVALLAAVVIVILVCLAGILFDVISG